MTLTEELFALRDEGYRDFQAKLMPTVDKDTVIGVRMPALRKFAAEFARRPEAKDFLNTLPHKYYEENNLHALLVEKLRDYDECIAALDSFLPCVDNWATCDMMNPKVLKKQPQRTEQKAYEWMRAGDTYTVRFGIGVLMSFFLDEHFSVSQAEAVAALRSEEYYIKMMQAWYFATALAKQYEAVLPFVENCRLDRWTHNKAIQKAVESYRITAEQKAYLKTLKQK